MPGGRVTHGGYRLRRATTDADLAAALELRAQAFRQGDAGAEREAFDATARHLLIEDRASGTLIGTFRYLVLSGPAVLAGTYSARFYDLTPLRSWAFPLVEIGRLCLRPDAGPGLMRLMLGAITLVADAAGASGLFGVTTLGPAPPGARRGAASARQPLRFSKDGAVPDGQVPPLVAAYLALGCRIGDRVVTDPDLGTRVLFTALDGRDIPPGRARSLKALAAELGPLDGCRE